MKPAMPTLLWTVNGLLLAAIATLWSVGDLTWQPPVARPPEPSSLQPASIEVVRSDLASLSQSLERPVFAQSRRPVPTVAEAEPASPEPDALRDVVLLGVVDAGGADRTVILRAEGKVRRVKIGEAVGEWSLQSMADSVAVFQRGAEQKRLTLTYMPQPLQARVAAPAAVEGQGQPAGESAKPGQAASQPAPVAARPATPSSSSGSSGSSLMQRIAERRARLALDKK